MDDWGGVGSWLQYGAASGLFMYGARALYNFYNDDGRAAGQQRLAHALQYLPWPGSSAAAPLTITLAGGGDSREDLLAGSGGLGAAEGARLLHAPSAAAAGGGAAGAAGAAASGGSPHRAAVAAADDVVVVDCTHASLPTLTHHKGDRNPPSLRRADTSTGAAGPACGGRCCARWRPRSSAVAGARPPACAPTRRAPTPAAATRRHHAQAWC
jgi:hypothetical protein